MAKPTVGGSERDDVCALLDMLGELDLEEQFETVMGFAGAPDRWTRHVAAIAATHLAQMFLGRGMHLRAMELMIAYGLPEAVEEAYKECIGAHHTPGDSIRDELDELYRRYRNDGPTMALSIMALQLSQHGSASRVAATAP